MQSKHTPYFECLEAVQRGGCPICYLAKRSVARYLDSLIYERVNDPKTRERTRAAQGFCRLHVWQLRHQGGALGIGIIYRDVVRDIAEALDGVGFNGQPRRSPLDALRAIGGERSESFNSSAIQAVSPTQECPACTVQHQTETTYVDILLDNLTEERMQAAFEQSDGLCLPHLRLALARTRNQETFTHLIRVERKVFRELLDNLDEMIRRSDYRYMDGLAQVGDAWIHAISHVAGREELS